jgi:hypothetical protein
MDESARIRSAIAASGNQSGDYVQSDLLDEISGLAKCEQGPQRGADRPSCFWRTLR